jgi:hypothetical protein
MAQKSVAPTVAPHVPQRSGATVTVGCKLPHGLVLRIFDFQEIRVPRLGGGEAIEKRAFQVGDPVRINGNAVAIGKIPEHEIKGGFALTMGVPADFFAKWLEQNADADIVRQGLIFAKPSYDQATGHALEHKALRSGLEPIDTAKGSKDPRMVRGIETAEKAA